MLDEVRERILIADDDHKLLSVLSDILELKGYQVHTARDGNEALIKIKNNHYDLAIFDIVMPGVDGMDVLRESVKIKPQMPVIMASAFATVKVAVEATKIGAYDFIEKPLDAERVLLMVDHALERARFYSEKKLLVNEALQRYGMIGISENIREVFRLIDLVAPTNSSVLIHGESGTGKELVARAIHLNSKRTTKPYVQVNCAAIPDSLFESELFGHKKGSFTGAIEDKEGKFQRAHNGTLFLDEVGDMTAAAQAKVLRALQDGEIQPVGSTSTVKVNVRVLAATNKSLTKEIEAGNFREDLYYRLNVIAIHVPTLRDRPIDIPILAQHFLEQTCNENNIFVEELAPQAIDALMSHDWPGNIRELSNVMEKLAILSQGKKILASTVNRALRGHMTETSKVNISSFKDARNDFEKKYILQALRESNWNIPKAADMLQLERTNLYKKMQKHAIQPPSQKFISTQR